MIKDIKPFLSKKHRVYYTPSEIVPFYKGLWYYDLPKNTNVCIILPLVIPLIILRDIYYIVRLFGNDSLRFYRHQIKLRKNNDK